MAKRRKSLIDKLVLTIILFIFSGFIMLMLKNMDLQTLIIGIAVPLVFLSSSMLIPKLFSADKLLLSLVNFLCSLGVLILYRMNPQRGINHAINYFVGLIAMVIVMLSVKYLSKLKRLSLLIGVASLVLMALPAVIGREVGGAKAWLKFGGVSFQPSEIVKVVLVFVNAYFLSKSKLLMSVLYTGLCLVMLVLQRDLGTALLYYTVTLAMMFIALGSWLLLISGVAGAVGVAVFGYSMLKKIGFAHLERRLQAWLNPWGNYQDAGYQTVQSLLAIVNGGAFGLGLGAGNAYTIPVKETDFIFPFIVNEFGIIFGISLIVIYIIIFMRGIGVAMRCNHQMHSLMAIGSSLFLAVQTFVIIGGNINMFPITGVTLPFISYGGSSLLSGMCMIGIIQGVENINKEHILQDEILADIGENA
ncbi:MAG: FtsW/RodA/SpoVE family cell cycle protein [Eubacteriales bacterium]|nr:FtsW/RodA/SpoVE family cell cycle protein [Eubacteriales bacterium]